VKTKPNNEADLPQVHSESIANIELHHGELRTAVGVHSYQVVRADRLSEGVEAWTYNHAPMLAFWNNRFYLQYLSNPVSEHVPPGRTLLTTSRDGRSWDRPRILFDEYAVPAGEYPGVDPELTKTDTHAVMHQRMGFYVPPDGRLLTLGFYGICPHTDLAPFDRRGIGRVVREIYGDGTWGAVYFIHLNTHAGWTRSNTRIPWYTESDDKGFIQACEALLSDALAVQQWLEEHGAADSRIALKGRYKAFSYYTLTDGRVVGLWKWKRAGISRDRGRSWHPIGEAPSLETAGGKVWGQSTSDGRYVLLYTPSMNNRHRWPLALTTADDGLNFGELCTVCGDVSPRRYAGSHKDFGQSYVRGIAEGNGIPPDGDVWVAYSMNKEDIWVTRISVPIRTTCDAHIDDDFSRLSHEEVRSNWSTFSPLRAPVALEPISAENDEQCLSIRDDDPYDYARAERSFPEGPRVHLRIDISASRGTGGRLFIEILDPQGRIPVRLLWDADGVLKVDHSRGLTYLIEYQADKRHTVEIVADARLHRFSIMVDGCRMGSDQVYQGERWSRPYWWFLSSVRSLSRLVLRTKPVHREPTVDTPLEPAHDLPEPGRSGSPVVLRCHRVVSAEPTDEESLA